MEWRRKRWNEMEEEEWNGGGRGGMKWRRRKGMVGEKDWNGEVGRGVN